MEKNFSAPFQEQWNYFIRPKPSSAEVSFWLSSRTLLNKTLASLKLPSWYENYAENYWAAGESTNNIGQEITGAATGGDDSYQYFYNYADLYYGDLSTYNVTQINTATLSATDYADQYLYNWIDWYNTHTGSIAMDILGDASADSVYQYHENWVEVYY